MSIKALPEVKHVQSSFKKLYYILYIYKTILYYKVSDFIQSEHLESK